MADDANVKIGFEVDSAAVERAKSAAAGVGSAYAKLAEEAERATKLDELSKTFAEQVKSGKDAALAIEDLNKELARLGATEKEAAKLAGDLDKQLKKVGVSDDALKAVRGEFTRIAGETRKATVEAERLKKTTEDIGKAAKQTGNQLDDSLKIAEGSGALSTAFSQVGGAASSLGLGSGLSDIGGIVGAVESIKNVKSAIGELGGVSASSALALGAVGVAFVALSAVISAFQSDMAKQADELNRVIDAGRAVDADIVAGLTRQEAEQKINNAKLSIQLEEVRLETLKAQYAEFERQAGILAPLAKIFVNQEEALLAQIGTSEQLLSEHSATVNAYSNAVEQGKFVVGDAIQAEKDLASARKESEKAAEQAAKERETEQKRAAQEAERAQEKAQQQAQARADAFSNAQNNYSKALQDAGRAAAQAAQDIKTKFKDTLKDLAADLARDVADMALEAQRDLQDLNTSAYRDAEKNQIDHLRKLDDIRRNAQNAERDAIRNQDALALAKAVEAGREQLDEEGINQARATQDQRRAYQERLSDLRQAIVRERADRQLAYQRSRQDAAINAERELRDAKLAKERSLAMAREAYQRELQMLQQKFSRELELYARFTQATGGAPMTTSNTRTTSNSITMNISGSQSPSAVANAVVQQLGAVGLYS